jgi:hypothetical protein
MSRTRWSEKRPLNDQQLAKLLADYFGLATVQEAGAVAWVGFAHDDYQLALLGCLQFPSSLPRDLKQACIWRASNDCVKASALSAAAFLEAINKHVAQHFSAPSEKATILTKVSCSPPKKNIKLQIDNFTLTVHCGVPGRLDTSPFSASHEVVPNVPEQYAFATAQAEGRTIADQFEQGLRELSIASALLNLLKTFGSRTIFTTRGNGLPLRQISFGQYFILFDTKLKRHEERYHFVYEDEPTEKILSPEETSKFLNDAKILTRRLRRHPLKSDIATALVMYQSALEARDLDSALMRVWSALEQLTFSPHGNDTVKRVSGLFHDREFAAAQLSAIRNHRNRGVHFGEHDEFALPMIQYCKHYFERVLLFILNNKMGFRTKQDIEAFLVASADHDIAKKVKVLQKRMRFDNRSCSRTKQKAA